MRAWLRLLILVLVLSPLGAAANNAPQVVMATPGLGGGSIERFTVRFSDPMVPLGDPRAAGPFTVEFPTAGQGRWADCQRLAVRVVGAAPENRLVLDRRTLGPARDAMPLLVPPGAHRPALVDGGGGVVDSLIFSMR